LSEEKEGIPITSWSKWDYFNCPEDEEDVLLTATGRAVCASDVFRCSCGSLNVHLIGTLLEGKLELAAMRCNDCGKEWLMVWSPWYDHAWDVFIKERGS